MNLKDRIVRRLLGKYPKCPRCDAPIEERDYWVKGYINGYICDSCKGSFFGLEVKYGYD